MRTQATRISKSTSASPAARHAAAETKPQAFRMTKRYDGFHQGQLVYLYEGPTYGVDCPGEIPVTVAPNYGPFVGLTPEYLESVVTH